LCHAVVVYFDREANKAERIPDEEREMLINESKKMANG